MSGTLSENLLRQVIRAEILHLSESLEGVSLFDPRFENARAGLDPEMKKQLNDLRRAHKIADFSKMSKEDWDAISVSNPTHPQNDEFSEYLENRPENVRYRYLSKGGLFGYDVGQALSGKRQGMRFIRTMIRIGAESACQSNPKVKALCDKQDPAALADPEWLEAALRGARDMDLD